MTNQLKLLRIKLELRQDELAIRLNVPRWKISLSERGHDVLSNEEKTRLENFFRKSAKALLVPFKAVK